MRIGQGVDAHAFKAGGTLVLGGVIVPHDYSLEAHSDGDVLLHALCDALLGAAGLGDIGQHFPPSDPTLRDIDSRVLLRRTYGMVREEGYHLVNADITVVAQAPKLVPYIGSMREYISNDLKASADQVNIKATTTEHLGFTGRGEGVVALAVVLLDD